MILQKKICMLGAAGVGKTSLVRRFVQNIYSEKYHTTIGVKIDKETLSIGAGEVKLLLWDLQGEDENFKIRPSFLRGASGYLLIVDLTRCETLVTAFSIQKMVEREVAKLPISRNTIGKSCVRARKMLKTLRSVSNADAGNAERNLKHFAFAQSKSFF